MLLALLALLLLAPLSLAGAQRATLIVQGTVVDSATGAPLGGVSLELLGTSVRAVAQSDGAGRFRIGGLRPGGYTLVVRRIGYAVRTPEPLALAHDTTLSLGLARLAQGIASVVVRDSSTGIHGVVGTAAGLHPLASARVQVAGVRGTFTADSGGRFFVPLAKAGTYAVRISKDGYRPSLRMVEVTSRRSSDGSALLDSAPGRLSPILAANWEDLDQRQRWRTMNSALVSGLDLAGRGGTVSDALLMTPAFSQRGLRVNGATCVFVDGVPRPGLPLDAVAPEQIEMIEVYGPGGEPSGNLIKRWPDGVECANPSRSTTAPGISERGIVRFAVVWLKH